MYEEIMADMIVTGIRSVSTFYTPENTRIKRKNRPNWALVLKYEGETVYVANGKRILSDANHLVLLPMGCSYDWYCTASGHFCIIEFDSPKEASGPISVTVKSSERILKMLRELECKRGMGDVTEIECIRDTYSILLAVLHAAQAPYLPTRKQQRIAPVLEYISGNYHTQIKNDTLAALIGVSNVYFRKLFVQVTGMSPIAYVNSLRIERAKEMLKSDYGSLSDVAQSLGYANLYDFSRAFKKRVGVSPSAYKKG